MDMKTKRGNKVYGPQTESCECLEVFGKFCTACDPDFTQVGPGDEIPVDQWDEEKGKFVTVMVVLKGTA